MKYRLLLVAIIAGLGMRAAFAHHSGAAFDKERTVRVSGVVAKLEWTNPHVRLYVDAESKDKTPVRWEFELPSVNRLMRNGWSRNSLKPGEKVTVTGNPARNYPHAAFALNVLDADDHKLFTEPLHETAVQN